MNEVALDMTTIIDTESERERGLRLLWNRYCQRCESYLNGNSIEDLSDDDSQVIRNVLPNNRNVFLDFSGSLLGPSDFGLDLDGDRTMGDELNIVKLVYNSRPIEENGDSYDVFNDVLLPMYRTINRLPDSVRELIHGVAPTEEAFIGLFPNSKEMSVGSNMSDPRWLQ